MAVTTTTTTALATPLVLPNLSLSGAIVTSTGAPSPVFQQTLNNAFSNLVSAFNSLTAQLAINAAQTATNEAQAVTNTAQLATNTAQAATDAAQVTTNTAQAATNASLLSQIASAAVQLTGLAAQITTLQTTAASLSMAQTAATLVSSYTTPGSVLSASTATPTSTSSTIVVADHVRAFGDGTSVAVTGATLTGLLLSTTYFVYYEDAARAGGSVTYHTSTDADAAIQIDGICCCGSIITPAPPASGSMMPATSIGLGVPAPGIPATDVRP